MLQEHKDLQLRLDAQTARQALLESHFDTYLTEKAVQAEKFALLTTGLEATKRQGDVLTTALDKEKSKNQKFEDECDALA